MRKPTATEIYWNDTRAQQSMADYLRANDWEGMATPARWAQPYLDHARPIPSGIRGSLITRAIAAGWTWREAVHAERLPYRDEE